MVSDESFCIASISGVTVFLEGEVGVGGMEGAPLLKGLSSVSWGMEKVVSCLSLVVGSIFSSLAGKIQS